MLETIRRKISGDGLGARVVRGSFFTFMGFGASQFLRLLSNLVLTRLLFPEAFGLIAIVTLFMTGLQMFSDTGLRASIVRSKRGHDPAFLNTAWVVEIIRHFLVGGICCLLAAPVARFYEEPTLEPLMFALALCMVIMGFKSTRIATATKDIMAGRLFVMDLSSQLVSIATMIAIASVWQSPWALMIGVLVAQSLKTILSHTILPGMPNRVQFEREAFWEQFHFCKYLFVSSGLTFLIENGDRLVLSKYLSLAYVGIYNIAFFFAAVPLTLMGHFANKIIFPLYSARPPAESEANRKAISKTRFALTGGMLILVLIVGILGQWLVEFLYTEEYYDAGPILVLLAVFLMPRLIIQCYPTILLAAGRSGLYMGFQAFRSTVQFAVLTIGLIEYGLIGAMASQVVSAFLIYPVMFVMIRPHKATDVFHDVFYLAVVAVFTGIIFWVNDDAWAQVLALSVQ